MLCLFNVNLNNFNTSIVYFVSPIQYIISQVYYSGSKSNYQNRVQLKSIDILISLLLFDIIQRFQTNSLFISNLYLLFSSLRQSQKKFQIFFSLVGPTEKKEPYRTEIRATPPLSIEIPLANDPAMM